MVSSCKYETCWIEQQVDEKAKQQQLFLDTEMQHEWNNDTVKQTAVQKHITFSAELDQPINGTSFHYISPHVSFCGSTAWCGAKCGRLSGF